MAQLYIHIHYTRLRSQAGPKMGFGGGGRRIFLAGRNFILIFELKIEKVMD